MTMIRTRTGPRRCSCCKAPYGTGCMRDRTCRCTWDTCPRCLKCTACCQCPTSPAALTMWAIRLLRQQHLHIDPIAVQHVAQVPLDEVIAEMNRLEQQGYQIYTYYPDVPDGCIVVEQR